MNVSGITNLNNTNVNQVLTVSGNTSFRANTYCNGNDNKVFSFDNSNYGHLGFIKQSGSVPKICAAASNSMVFAHLSSGDLTQTISSTGITVLDRMVINAAGNV